MFKSAKNDGTIAITRQVKEPMQGTYIGEENEKLIVAKGIVRPPFRHQTDGTVEKCEAVEEAAFGKLISDAPEGEFFRAKEVGSERCNMGYQTLLFAAQEPWRFIDKDSSRLEGITGLDLLSSEARAKVKCGVPPQLLIEEMAPWQLLRRFNIKGVRATVYGSSLVKRGDDVEKTAMGEMLEELYGGVNIWGYSWFCLLPNTAYNLADAMHCTVEQLSDRLFLIHRDPALPDATTLYPARFAGIVEWDVLCSNDNGIVFHPEDPFWHAAGGDFDGDAAAIYPLLPSLQPMQAITRPDYKVNGRQYHSTSVAEQIAEAASDKITDLLGPVTLGMMRLIERDAAPKHIRAIGAGTMQAAVQAKKHSVDREIVSTNADLLRALVRQASHNGDKPFISDYINLLNNTPGVEGKLKIWEDLMQHINNGTWVEHTRTEGAMIRRIKLINRIFEDVKFFEQREYEVLPKAMQNNAAGKASPEATTAIKGLVADYRMALAALNNESTTGDMETYQEEVRVLRSKFRIACITGKVDNVLLSPKDAQYAVVAYGSPSIAARYVSSEVFEEVGVGTKKIIINLRDKGWADGEYHMTQINPIPNCLRDFELFSKESPKCKLEVMSFGPRSTRVILTTL